LKQLKLKFKGHPLVDTRFEKLKQLKLKFKGHPLVDTRFEKGTVCLSYYGEKEMTVVANIWAMSDKQAFIKAAKKIEKTNIKYDSERSFFRRSSS